ncbi:MAG: hypothetical protein Q7S52_00340 [bacterium]|nr:hypothetical protein [bacterium]
MKKLLFFVLFVVLAVSAFIPPAASQTSGAELPCVPDTENPDWVPDYANACVVWIPHIAASGEEDPVRWETIVTIINNSIDKLLRFQLLWFDDSGNAFNLLREHQILTGATWSDNVQPRERVELTYTSPTSGTISGGMRVEIIPRPGSHTIGATVFATFQLRKNGTVVNMATVPAMLPQKNFTLSCSSQTVIAHDISDGDILDCGVAFTNPVVQTAVITATVWRSGGTKFGEFNIPPLPKQGHIARMLSEFFPFPFPGGKYSVEISSNVPFVGIGLQNVRKQNDAPEKFVISTIPFGPERK